MIKDIHQEFRLAGYDLEIKYDNSRPVHSAVEIPRPSFLRPV